MKNVPLQFGRGQALAGILTLPEREAVPGPALVIASSRGAGEPHAGAWVTELARAVSGAGLTVLRFDPCGSGESAAVPAGEAVHEALSRDHFDAIDAACTASQRGAVVLLASGAAAASTALAAALAEPRVCGVIGIDGPAFDTPGPLVRRWLDRLDIRGRGSARRAPATASASPMAPRPDRAAYLDTLQRLVERGTRIFCLYTGASGARSLRHAARLRDLMPGLRPPGHLRVGVLPDSDNAFAHAADRALLVQACLDWLGLARTPGPPPPGADP